MVAVLLLSTMLAAAPAGGQEARRLPPADQCASDPSFVTFREELLAVIARRDRDALLAIVADDIDVDFGGGAGRDYFAQAWQLERPETSPLWNELGQALSLGCSLDTVSGSYAVPYMFLGSEDVIEDPFTGAVAIRPGAPLRALPQEDADVVAALDWDVLTVPDWDPGEPWQRVELADGRSGYVRTEDIRSPVDYRGIFQRVDGRWRLVTFIAGD